MRLFRSLMESSSFKSKRTISTTKTKTMGFSYKECLKNHAASIGGHAVDGCGEFMASPASNPTDPSSLLCVACGCHRNFHRRYSHNSLLLQRSLTPSSPSDTNSPPPSSPPPPPPETTTTHVASPVPRSYYASGPHMLFNLSSGGGGFSRPSDLNINVEASIPTVAMRSENSSQRGMDIKLRRSRTKFTQHQKEMMRDFAEKNGWKIKSCDATTVDDLCREAGINRDVLKVWMHNNKNRFGVRRVCLNSFGGNNGGGGGGDDDNVESVGIRVSGDGSSTS